MTELADGNYSLTQQGIQVWCVFDRDIEDDSNDAKGNTSFNASISIASNSGIKVAWSNDSFELWILLHFEDIDCENPVNKRRQTYYNRLTEIFRNVQNPNQDLKNALRHSSFGYKKDLKSKNNFRNIVRAEIISKTRDAIERSKQLEEYHITHRKPLYEHAPCTLVHKLVEELLNIGGKSIL